MARRGPPTRWPEFNAFPDECGHYLYALEVAPGVIKVGRTSRVRERMKHYAREFRRSPCGWSMGRIHVERTSNRPSTHEMDLLARLARLGSVLPGRREFFTGVPWGAVVTLIRQVSRREYATSWSGWLVDYERAQPTQSGVERGDERALVHEQDSPFFCANGRDMTAHKSCGEMPDAI